ncbi:MetQ/NlpA family ABC transporter substrate-binding protein [Nostoc sp. DSM 114161]|uniref:MetQ/NlpA family ABC transporter substrate-binding protein n=1 Tax=Nostoc sp. DSM 114161 TaxID=3440143 RepID=UPI00404642AA
MSQTEQKEVIKVRVTGIVSQDILKFVNNNLAAQECLEIQVVTFNDWIQPNTALRDKVIKEYQGRLVPVKKCLAYRCKEKYVNNCIYKSFILCFRDKEILI